MLVLRWAGSDDRRKVFAYKFTAEAIAWPSAPSSRASSSDLSRVDGMTFAFITAGAGFAISALLIHVAGIGAPAEVAPDLAAGEAETRVSTVEALRRIFAVPAPALDRRRAVALALGFYAQVRVRSARLTP